MTIISKFNIGERVYWLQNNSVQSAIVKSIQFPLVQWIDRKHSIGRIMYFVSKNKKSSIINWNGGGLYENQIFISKKELLKSL